jgi:peptidyl-tRNA hydrolase, PTH1 family
MWLLAGLGNFGAEYVGTRHNAGFIAVDEIVSKHGLQSLGKKFNSICWKGFVGSDEIFAIAPQTYMNKSGAAVVAAANFYKIPCEKLIIIHDDLDLETGRIKVKFGGGNGGHNGLKDVDRTIGNNYWRVRIGIDRPNHAAAVSSYVLHPFTSDERSIIDATCDFIAQNISLLLQGQEQKFMNEFALNPKP